MSLSRRLAPEIVGCENIPEAESLLNKEFRDLLEAFCKLPVIEELNPPESPTINFLSIA